MKKLLIATGIVVATASGAFAQSSLLDVYNPAPVAASAIDYAATAAIDADYMAQPQMNPRLGDGAPTAVTIHNGLDFTSTSAIDNPGPTNLGPRLGDGAPIAG